MKKSILYFNSISLKAYQIHKLRGYVGNLFKDNDLIHNHDIVTGKMIYRYPLIQFKIINDMPAIIALTEKAVNIFTELFMSLDEIVIDDKTIPVLEKDLSIENCNFCFSKETYLYKFTSPWIALNQNNFRIYTAYKTQKEKNDLLKRVLTGNLLSMAKYLGLHLESDQRIRTDLQAEEVSVTLKGKQMLGFKGIFKVNFEIPDYLGLGKSVSRGYGTIKKLL